MFRKIALAGAAALSLAACTQHEQRVGTGAALGAGAGAVIGAVTTGDAEGALVGAAIGGATGAILGHVTGQPGRCYTRDQYGQTIIIDCPPGY
ncbi:MAG TPA: glycine zipper domain-containing protein [Propylenella sp.]|nr:glycine zipper domain-containing protein [Propylenella sp.]